MLTHALGTFIIENRDLESREGKMKGHGILMHRDLKG